MASVPQPLEGQNHRFSHSNQQISDRGMRNQLRLKKKIDDLQRQWELLDKKLSGLNEQWILETRAEEKLRQKNLIDDTETLRHQVEEQLKDMESQLVTRRVPLWALIVIIITLILIPTSYFFYEQWAPRYHEFQRYIAEGREFLAIGRYDKAKQAYQEALAVYPGNPKALFGLDKVDAFDTGGDLELSERKLRQLEKRAPDDSDVQMLLGRFYAAQHEVEKATQHYNNAIKLDPAAAEAYFGLGVLSYEQGDIREAMKNYEEAVKISDTTPKYVNNLADLYAQQGYYAKAIALYGKLPQTFPIASLEIAHVHRLMGDPLEIAQRLQEKVLELLGNQQIMDQPENQEPWEYRTDQAIITLTDLADKQCYVYYSLAATLYIDGQTADAEAYVNKAHALRRPYERYIRALVDYDLRRLAEKKSEWQEPINAYRQRFLK